MTTPAKPKLKLKTKATAPAAAPKAATPAKASKKKKSKTKAKVVVSPAPMERKRASDDRPFTVNLRGRHADWIEMRAAQNRRTPAQQIEKVVREGYALDPNNKTGASTNDSTKVGELAERKQQAAGG